MSLPTPRLDDRTFEDIRREALQRIPQLCPEWTDFNPSDPGITVVELMAWMTEVMLYRLNRVPEKNYIKFLELMGVELRAAKPARTWVKFVVQPTSREDSPSFVLIEAGTTLSTRSGEGSPLSFRTVRSLNPTAAQIVQAWSRSGEFSQDLTSALLASQQTSERASVEPPSGVQLFSAVERMPHILFLADQWLADWIEGSELAVDVELAEPLPGGIQVEWERWVADRWEPIVPVDDETTGFLVSGVVRFELRSPFEATKVGGEEGYWLRARLVGAPSRRLPRLVRVERSMRLGMPDAAVAENAFLGTDVAPYQPIDLAKDFFPFGFSPKPGTVFYVCSPLFQRPKTRFEMSVSSELDAGGDIADVDVVWEYFSENGRWQTLGADDNTAGLTESGIIGFQRPDDLAQFTILGEPRWCVRARLETGGYGCVPAHLEEGKWVDEKEGSPPVLRLLSISFSEQFQPWEAVKALNYGQLDDLTSRLGGVEPTTPFIFHPDDQPMLMLAFDQRPANITQYVFLQIRERLNPVPGVTIWEYWDGKRWAPVDVREDGTAGLSRTGLVELLGPDDWQPSTHFGATGHWLRTRWEAGDYGEPPRCYGLCLNVIDAVEGTVFEDEILGSSTGEPLQSFDFWNQPVVEDPLVEIREADKPTTQQTNDDRIPALQSDLPEEDCKMDEQGNMWIRWRQVDNFYHSPPEGRHFVFDRRLGAINFGDGKRGRVPPQGRDNIRATYIQGSGSRGNIPVGTLTVLDRRFDGIKSVVNIEPATGGADAETIDAARLRGPWTLKHRYRAVTCEDFERLAKEASPDVARTWCYETDGIIHVLILPDDRADRPVPSSRLIERVREYLDERRIVTTRIAVRGPDYDDIEITVLVHPTSEQRHRFAAIEEVIKGEIMRFLHPLRGGADGTGWPIGRTVHVSELYYRVEQIPGIDFAESITMRKSASTAAMGKIRIRPRSFPYVREIQVTQI